MLVKYSTDAIILDRNVKTNLVPAITDLSNTLFRLYAYFKISVTPSRAICSFFVRKLTAGTESIGKVIFSQYQICDNLTY